MDLLRKIQNQPLRVRKIILWSVVICLALIFLFLWVNSFQGRMKKIQQNTFFSSPPSGEQLKAREQ